MNLSISELEQIITEELDNIFQESNNQNLTALERYILSESDKTLVQEQLLASLVAKYGPKVARYLQKKLRRKKRRGGGRSRAKRQNILLQRINKDKSGTSKGANITLQDIQKALESIPASAKFAKAAKPGVYDKNTYRAIVAFQRKYRGELQDKRLDGLVGPSTIGVLRNYDKSGVFSKKLDTKGVAIGAGDKMLKGIDKVAASKPGPGRLKALTNLAIQQPDSFIKYFRQLRKQIPNRGGIAKLSEQENILEPEDVTGGFVRGQEPKAPTQTKLSDKELAISKRIALLNDMRKALVAASKQIKDKDPKTYRKFVDEIGKTNPNLARNVDKNFVSPNELKSAMSEEKIKRFANGLYRAMDGPFSGKAENFLNALQNKKAIYRGRYMDALAAVYYAYGKKENQNFVQWLEGEQALKGKWPGLTREALANSKNAPKIADIKKASQKSPEPEKSKTQPDVKKKKGLLEQFPTGKNLVGTTNKVTLGKSVSTFTFKKNGMMINPGGDYKFTSGGAELNVDSVKVSATGDSVTMEMSFFGVGGKATFNDQQLLRILKTLSSRGRTAVTAGGRTIIISKR